MPKTDGGSLNCWRQTVRKRGSMQDGKTPCRKWYEWLEEMKKDEEEKMDEMHHQKVAQMIESTDGSAGLLHRISKPTSWRGGAQILKKEEEDARLLDCCEAKRKDWAKHWQCDESVQNMEDKLLKNEELKKLEETLPRLKEGEQENVSRLYKAATGVGCDSLHPRVPLDLKKETRGEIVEFLENVGAEWKMAATNMHDDVLLDSQECHVRDHLRVHAHVCSLVGSRESTGSGKVAAEVSSGLWDAAETEEPSERCE